MDLEEYNIKYHIHIDIMSCSLIKNLDERVIIQIGIVEEYNYIYLKYKDSHRRLISHIISQMLRDYLDIIYSNDNYLQDFTQLSKIEFRCECMAESTTYISEYDCKILRNNKSHKRSCLETTISSLKPIVMKLITHNKSKIIDAFAKKEIDKINMVSKQSESEYLSTGSFYNDLHAGLYDNLNNYIDQHKHTEAYDYIKSQINTMVRRMITELIICRNLSNPIFLKFDNINGYFPLRIICESSKTVVIEAVKDEKSYVIKISSSNDESVKLVLKELNILNSLESPPSYIPNVIDSFIMPAIFSGPSHICIVFDLLGLDLFEKILNNVEYYKKGLDIESIRYIAYQLVEAIRYLHHRHLIHNDIKLENILFKNSYINKDKVLNEQLIDLNEHNDMDIVLIDYGLTEDDRNEKANVQGTIPYLSPEEIEGHCGTFATDIWSFGVVILELVTGITIFSTDVLKNMILIEALTSHNFDKLDKGIKQTEHYLEIRNKILEKPHIDIKGVRYDMHYISASTNDVQLADFLYGCLNHNSNERLTIDQLYYHPFLNLYVDQDRQNKIF